MSWIGIILGVLIFATHIGSAIAKESARRKEKERLRQAELQRQQTGISASPTRGEVIVDQPIFGGSETATTPMPVSARARPSSPVDDLAARRREQLEQLRNRREAKRLPTGQSTPQRLDVSQRPGVRDTGEALREDLASRARRQEAQRKSAEQARTAQKREAQAQARSRRQQAARTASLAAAQKARQQSAPQHVISQREVTGQREVQQTQQTQATRSVARQTGGVGNLRRQLKNRASLRELFVLKEIIDLPVSLRERG